MRKKLVILWNCLKKISKFQRKRMRFRMKLKPNINLHKQFTINMKICLNSYKHKIIRSVKIKNRIQSNKMFRKRKLYV